MEPFHRGQTPLIMLIRRHEAGSPLAQVKGFYSPRADGWPGGTQLGVSALGYRRPTRSTENGGRRSSFRGRGDTRPTNRQQYATPERSGSGTEPSRVLRQVEVKRGRSR